MPQLSQRVSLFTDSVIRRMTRISDAHDAINLSQGFPDFNPPQEILDALAKTAYSGPHQYSVTFGAPNMRQALAAKYSPVLGWDIDPENEVLVTCGSTEAMMCAMMTICNPGDRVAIFSPFYENYEADTILTGADPIFIPLTPPSYTFDLAEAENAFQQGAKALILCNPSNPCGKVFSRKELEQIAALAIRYDALVITDEVYEHLVYAPYVHTYMASLPGMRERTLTCNSLSKTYSITGWRLGFMIGPPEIMECTKKVHDFLTVGAPSPLQEAACVGLAFGPEYYEDLRNLYTHKRDFFCGHLERMGLPHTVPQGSYFVLADISRFLAMKRFAGWSDLQFCEWMTVEIGVAAVPGSSFFREDINHLIRLHFARSEETLMEALNRLERLVQIQDC